MVRSLLCRRIQNALINRTFFQQRLLELRIRDDALLNEELCECVRYGPERRPSVLQGYRFAASSSATASPINHLSARASNFCGIVTPICFALLRLIANSNLLGCSTGRSAGLAPFRFVHKLAARRYILGRLLHRTSDRVDPGLYRRILLANVRSQKTG